MPTESLESILNRDLSIVAAKEVIAVSSPLLKEWVNFSTHVYKRCETSATDPQTKDLAILTLYLHIIEMTDGVEILISQSCPAPAIPLIRSAFEAVLSIEYILEKDYEKRSLAWSVEYTHNRLKSHELLDPQTTRGKEFWATFKAEMNDTGLQQFDVNITQAAQKVITDLNSFLAQPEIQSIETEYRKFKSKRWYQLFDGPKNLHGLASHLKAQGQYDLFYRQWSSVAHAQDASRFMISAKKADPATRRPLRDPHSIQQMTLQASLISLQATKLVLGKFRPEEIAPNGYFPKWYANNIQKYTAGLMKWTGT